jgi:hypothetical protein
MAQSGTEIILAAVTKIREDETAPPRRHPIAQALRRLYLALESIRLDELGEMAKIKR